MPNEQALVASRDVRRGLGGVSTAASFTARLPDLLVRAAQGRDLAVVAAGDSLPILLGCRDDQSVVVDAVTRGSSNGSEQQNDGRDGDKRNHSYGPGFGECVCVCVADVVRGQREENRYTCVKDWQGDVHTVDMAVLVYAERRLCGIMSR